MSYLKYVKRFTIFQDSYWYEHWRIIRFFFHDFVNAISAAAGYGKPQRRRTNFCWKLCRKPSFPEPPGETPKFD